MRSSVIIKMGLQYLTAPAGATNLRLAKLIGAIEKTNQQNFSSPVLSVSVAERAGGPGRLDRRGFGGYLEYIYTPAHDRPPTQNILSTDRYHPPKLLQKIPPHSLPNPHEKSPP